MNVKKILKEGIWIYVLMFIAAIAGYFVRVLYARSFSIVEYGLFYAVLSFMFILSPLRELGFNAANTFFMNRYVAKKEYGKAKAVFIIGLATQLILSIALAAIIYYLKPYLIAHFFKNPLAGAMIDILLIYSVVDVIITPLSNIFICFQKNFLFQLRDHLIVILTFFFSLLLYKLNFSIILAPLSYLFAGLAVLIIYIALYKVKLKQLHVPPQYNKKIIKDTFFYSIVVSIGSFAWIILGQLNTNLLTWLKGLESVGYYNIVLPSLQIVFLLTGPVLNTLFSVTVNLFHNKRTRELSSLSSFVYNNFLIFTLPLASILFVYSREIIKFIFGIKYIAASAALKLYIIFWIFIFFRHVNFTLLEAIGEVRYSSKILWLEVAFDFVIGIILIQFFDYTGAVIAAGMGSVVMTLVTYNFLRKKIAIKIDYRQQCKILMAGLVFLLSAIFLERRFFASIGRWAVVIDGFIVLFISSILYLICLIAMKVITKEKIDFFRSLIHQRN